MRVNEFSIQVKDGLTIDADYSGKEDSDQVILLVHGFGVTKESYGFFDVMRDQFTNSSIVVRFNFNIIDENGNTTVSTFAEHELILKTIIDFIRQKFAPKTFKIIAHSLGGAIVGIVKPRNIDQIVLVAPTPTSPYKRLQEYFGRKEGSEINKNGISKLKRSNGKWTFVKSEFWEIAKSLDPIKDYRELAKLTDLTIIQALNDQIIQAKSYQTLKDIDEINFLKLPGNHMFENEASENFFAKLKKIID